MPPCWQGSCFSHASEPAPPRRRPLPPTVPFACNTRHTLALSMTKLFSNKTNYAPWEYAEREKHISHNTPNRTVWYVGVLQNASRFTDRLNTIYLQRIWRARGVVFGVVTCSMSVKRYDDRCVSRGVQTVVEGRFWRKANVLVDVKNLGFGISRGTRVILFK